MNLGNRIKHEGMSYGLFKDPFCNPYLAGSVVPSCSLTQEIPGSNNLETEFSEFSENI